MKQLSEEEPVKTQLEVGPFLAPGSKAEVHPRLADTPRSGKPVKTAKISPDGSVTLEGLEPFAPYWLVGEDEHGNPRAIQFDAAGKVSAVDPSSRAGLTEQLEARSVAVDKLRESVGIKPGSGHAPDDRSVPENIPDHNWEKGAATEPTTKFVDESGPQRQGADIGTAFPKKQSAPKPKGK